MMCLDKRISLESLFAIIISKEDNAKFFPKPIEVKILIKLIFEISMSADLNEREFYSTNHIKIFLTQIIFFYEFEPGNTIKL